MGERNAEIVRRIEAGENKVVLVEKYGMIRAAVRRIGLEAANRKKTQARQSK